MKADELYAVAARLGCDKVRDPARFQTYLREQGLDMEHLYQELEMSQRYVNTHRDEGSATVALHSHDFYELLYCENTCGAEYLVGKSRYRIQRGDVVLVPPGVSHRPLLPTGMTESYRRDVVWMSREFVDWVVGSFSSFFSGPSPEQSGFLLRTQGTAWESVGDLFSAGVREAERRAPGWDVWVTANTLMLLTQLYRAAAEKNAPVLAPEQPGLMDLVVAYIEDNLAHTLTLSETARRFFVSESTITQTFRRKMGLSFYRYVTQRRLIAAKSLILQGVPLGEINEQVGFSDYSSFYRAFKGEYGISPRQFQKLQQGEEPV